MRDRLVECKAVVVRYDINSETMMVLHIKHCAVAKLMEIEATKLKLRRSFSSCEILPALHSRRSDLQPAG